MDCIFNNFYENDQRIVVENDSFYHLSALRIRIGEEILITNGDGLMAKCSLISINKKSAELEIIEINENIGESPRRIGLAIGILDNRDRLEFAFEKSIELGITDFYPLNARYSSNKKYDTKRLNTKAIAAICQSKRSKLPIINETITFDEYIRKIANEYDYLFLADIEGSDLELIPSEKSCCILVGPEGGFSEEEIQIIKALENSKLVKLGDRRLRAETAAITLVSAISLNFHI